MQFGRRYWTIATTGILLVFLAILFQELALLIGGATIGGWLLARQYLFVRGLTQIRQNLYIEQEAAQQSSYTDESITVTLSPRLQIETPLEVLIESQPPITATGSTREERITEPGQSVTHTVSFPIAGEFTFGEPVVSVRDPNGFFAEEFSAGFGPTVRVKPRAPRNVHVGQGGSLVATAYGEHEASRLGSGLDPAELRAYQAGDAAYQIDWKATARFGEPFVREFEAETNHETVLLFDHRSSTGLGPDGETELEYLKQVALAFVNTARQLNDPIAFYGVGDAGITTQVESGAGRDHYRRIRREVLARTPTTQESETRITVRSPATAYEAATHLRNDTDPFAMTLRPFFAASRRYVSRLERDPLVQTIRSKLLQIRGDVWTVIFTNDTNRVELTEAIKLARRGNGHVLVFLTPAVLFERGGLSDLETAYERYVDFEEFRRTLARIEGVNVFEVGPGDRLNAILAPQQRRRSTTPK